MFLLLLLCIEADHYATLGVTRDASASHIKAAYRKFALSHHPDKTRMLRKEEQEKSQQLFVKVNEAFEVLGDADKRREYDASFSL